METDRLWWKHGVLYQIYPRSFFDSNGDGIGDIPGITQKLDYIAALGVDGIWLSPINTSPMYDFGYDISDYRAIDPVFGADGDFQRLIEEAHARGIRIIMDLVVNHTSHLHPWFIESRASKDNPKRDWYIWRDGINGEPPNNWMAAFGGRAWEWDSETGQYYLHSFLKEQPDVNWRNERLKKAIFGEIRYWLDRGVDGFRLDVVNQFVKDDRFRSNPFTIGPRPRPYDMQRHLYDRNRPELHGILREFRALLDRYHERMSVGEINAEPPGDPVLAASYLGSGDDELHLAFDFSLLFTKWSARRFFEVLKKWDGLIPAKGWPCYVLSNHDQPRAISRYASGNDTMKRAKVAAAMLLTLRGTPFIYYGEEIGMENGRLRRKEIVDPLGKKYWPFHPGRDPERTPMQWDSSPHAGFSAAAPWLPINPDYREINVERSLRDPGSLLNFYKELIKLRREKPALNRGGWRAVAGMTGDVLGYFRETERQSIFVALNFSRATQAIAATGSDGIWKALFSTHKPSGDCFSGLRMKLAPYEVVILERIG